MPTSPLGQLGQFRSELHACFPCRADALFELGEALLCAPAITSVARLSLAPSHPRRRASARLELGKTLLCARAITSVARLSLEPSHRRGWGSASDALANGRITVD